MKKPELLTTKQAADYLCLAHVQRVRQFVHEGRLATYLRGPAWLFSREELRRFKRLPRFAGRPKKLSK